MPVLVPVSVVGLGVPSINGIKSRSSKDGSDSGKTIEDGIEDEIEVEAGILRLLMILVVVVVVLAFVLGLVLVVVVLRLLLLLLLLPLLLEVLLLVNRERKEESFESTLALFGGGGLCVLLIQTFLPCADDACGGALCACVWRNAPREEGVIVEVDSMDVMDGIEAIEAIEVTDGVVDEGMDGMAEECRLPFTETVTKAVLALLEWPVVFVAFVVFVVFVVLLGLEEEEADGEEGASTGYSGVRCLVFLAILSLSLF